MTGLRIDVEPLLDEVAEVFAAMPSTAADGLVEDLATARRIVLYGVGRSGLVMRALAMRLHHLGLDAHAHGDMTVPPVGPGDLVVVNAGMGALPTGLTIAQAARAAGARLYVITARPQSPIGQIADAVLHLPAQTLADDGGAPSAMPMGSQYECAQMFLFELVVLKLCKLLGRSFDDMKARHTNLL